MTPEEREALRVARDTLRAAQTYMDNRALLCPTAEANRQRIKNALAAIDRALEGEQIVD